MTGWDRRLEREYRTLEALVAIHCRSRHRPRSVPCPGCRSLLEYGRARLERCPFKDAKPTCAKCPVHCYRPEQREAVRELMRFSGPRLLWQRPLLALLHFLDGFRKASRPR